MGYKPIIVNIMKIKTIQTIMTVLLLSFIIGNINALDIESYFFVVHLLSLTSPRGPEIFDDGIVFTASSSFDRVGIAFAHEGFGKVHWFNKLMRISEEVNNNRREPIYIDSGILFLSYNLPKDLRELEYRMIIGGLWTTDPFNSRTRTNASGITVSVFQIPETRKTTSIFDAPAGSILFSYTVPSGKSGELITVAGTFNGWDPFMYRLRETSPGNYSLILPLPPGTYHYVFFHRGQRILDPNNANRVFTRDGKVASSVVVK